MMTSRISITGDPEYQATAAANLSDVLDELGCPHAYIGGFAFASLGSGRLTEINVLIEVKDTDISVVRQRVTELNKRFALVGFKLFFVTEPLGDRTGEELVRTSKDNVVVETLIAGTLGLPKIAGPIYEVFLKESGKKIKILHPGVLILTKMKRWVVTQESTRPKTITKNGKDFKDLNFLMGWLGKNIMTIEFDEYEGKTKEELLVLVRKYREVVSVDLELTEALRAAMKPEDWALLDSDAHESVASSSSLT